MDARCQAALSHYPLRPRRTRLLQNDRETVWRIDARDAGSFLLRVYSHGDRRTIESQCQWLLAIGRDTHLTVPEPIANKNGEMVTLLVGGKRAVLTRWVPGRRRFRRLGPGADVLEKVGRLMARLHQHGLKFKPDRGFACPRWDWAGLFGRGSPWRPRRGLRVDASSREIFNLVRRRARNVMNDLGTGPDVFGLIHGDLMQANYLIDGNRLHANDFADFGRGYFLYDMAVTLLMLRPFDPAGRQRAAFIHGYRQVRALPLKQEALLDTFIAIRAIVLCRWLLGAEKVRREDRQWSAATLRWVGETMRQKDAKKAQRANGENLKFQI